MVSDGKEVEKGDTVIVFDPSEIKKAIITSEQQLEIANAEFEKLKATQQSELEDLEADLEIARISQEISKINFEQAVYESDVTKKEINLKLETANIALARAKEQIDNRKKIQKEDVFQKTLAIKQLSATLEDANNNVNKSSRVNSRSNVACIISELRFGKLVMNKTKTEKVKPAKIEITEDVFDKWPIKLE